MADVKVSQAHSLPLDQVRARMSEFEEMMGKYGVKASWSGNKAKLKGVGVSGDINVSDSDVAVGLKLGMMAKAAGVDAKRLEASISKRLKAAFEG